MKKIMLVLGLLVSMVTGLFAEGWSIDCGLFAEGWSIDYIKEALSKQNEISSNVITNEEGEMFLYEKSENIEGWDGWSVDYYKLHKVYDDDHFYWEVKVYKYNDEQVSFEDFNRIFLDNGNKDTEWSTYFEIKGVKSFEYFDDDNIYKKVFDSGINLMVCVYQYDDETEIEVLNLTENGMTFYIYDMLNK